MNNEQGLYDVKLVVAYHAEQPIVHTEETVGNISKLKKLRVMHQGQPVSVPALSGNSFRGQFRDILADQLCSRLREQGNKLQFNNNEVYAILYSGGALGEGSTSGELIKSFSELLPSMRLMGAAFGNVMLPSKLAATHIIPLAKETQEILKRTSQVIRDILPQDSTLPEARTLVFNDGPLTRKDDRRDLTKQRFAEAGASLRALAESDEAEQRKSQMIYYVECIPPGTWLLQQLYSKFPLDELELGCLLDGLTTFLQQPVLGGRSSAGYGQVGVNIKGSIGNQEVEWTMNQWAEGKRPPEDIIKKYETYLESKKGEILDALSVQSEKDAKENVKLEEPEASEED